MLTTTLTRRPHASVQVRRSHTLVMLTVAALAAGLSGIPALAATSSPTVSIAVSTSTSRANPVALAGRSLTGSVAIFTTNDAVVKTVRFYRDGGTTPVHTEGYGPFDYVGTAADGSAILLNAASLGGGSHTIRASVDLVAGGTISTSATFSVVTTTTPVLPPAPSVPNGLAAAARDASVALTWTSTSGATSYQVLRGGVVIASPGSPSYTDTGLANGTTYSYAVRAVNSGGTSAASAAVTATPVATTPATPTGLTAKAGNASVALTWTASATATGYRVRRGGVGVASTSATSWTDTGLANGATYTYDVSAVTQNSAPSSPSSPVSATPKAPSTMPTAALPGWTQVLADDFTTDAPLGSFLSTYSSRWGAYPAGWLDTSGNGHYDPARTLSVSNGNLDIWLHSENGVRYVSAPTPKLPSMTYGRYSIRFQSDVIPGYKTAWLLWPDDNVWPAHGEIDFPEGNLDSTISAFSHWASTGGGQDAFSTAATYSSWHTATIEWIPGKVTFILDGAVVGTSTRSVPTTPMHWVIQSETQLSGGAPSTTVAGHIRIDWVAAWTYTP